MSYNGKNPEAVSGSVSYLKKLQSKYGGTNAAKISNFYLGLDYMRTGKLKKASAYFKGYAKDYPRPGSNNLTYLAYSNLAAIAMLEKDYKGAVSYFSEMAKIGDVKLQEYAMLEEAALYTQIKEPKKAVAIYNTMLTNDAMTKDRGYIENLIQLNS
jgi:outer membrane protein assembly factor BamD (BamD/ComL family)